MEPKQYIIKQGKISNAHYGEVRGLLTCILYVTTDSTNHELIYGDFVLTSYDTKQRERIIYPKAQQAMDKLYNIFNTTNVESIIDKHIYILQELGGYETIFGVSPDDNIQFHSFYEIIAGFDLNEALLTTIETTTDQKIMDAIMPLFTKKHLEQHLMPKQNKLNKIKV